MSHYLCELYSAKPSWFALNPDERQRFFNGIGAGMAALSELGVEVIAMGETEAAKPYAVSQTFFAIWRFPNADALNALLDGIEASGWHNYFETVNAAGAGHGLAEHLEQLIRASPLVSRSA